MKTYKNTGIVFLIGAGPGDPGLLTLKGKACIEQADTIIYDYLANRELLKFSKPNAEIIFAGKRKGNMILPQEKINELLVEKAREGRTVARLKGGDPFIFGRGGEEALALVTEGIPFEVVPGVTSAVAVAAYAGIPLTHRDYVTTLAFTSGHEDPSKHEPKIPWRALAKDMGTVVFYMGISNLQGIVSNLIKFGCDPKTPIALIRWGTRPDQETLVGTLENIVRGSKIRAFSPPVTIIVGEVVRLRKDLNWFEKKPLFRKRVLVTRASGQAKELVQSLSHYGAEPVEYPTIQIIAVPDFSDLDQALKDITSYDWLIFTSANAVKFFFERLTSLRKDARTLAGIEIAVIGEKTRDALKKRNVEADLVSEEAVAEGLVEAFSNMDLFGKHFLIPRAREAREVLPEALRKKGGVVDIVEVYQTVIPDGDRDWLVKKFKNKEIDVVTFTSASTVRNFFEMIDAPVAQKLLEGVVLVSIGPITQQEVENFGMKIQVLPQEQTVESMVEALVHYFEKGERS